MTDPNPNVLTIPNTEVRVPAKLELPAHIDTHGKVWPVGGLSRVTHVPVATLLEAGVALQWRLPDGNLIDQETGSLLVAARQADMDRGYQPVFTDIPAADEPASATDGEPR